MEEEKFLSGYCRRLDCSRMVSVLLENGKLAEADCDYDSCPYRADCPIGKELAELTAETEA